MQRRPKSRRHNRRHGGKSPDGSSHVYCRAWCQPLPPRPASLCLVGALQEACTCYGTKTSVCSAGETCSKEGTCEGGSAANHNRFRGGSKIYSASDEAAHNGKMPTSGKGGDDTSLYSAVTSSTAHIPASIFGGRVVSVGSARTP